MSDSEALVPELLHRGRFQPVPGAVAEQTGPNVYCVVVPKSEAVRGLLRQTITPETFDDAVWLIDDEESLQSLGTSETDDHVEVTVLLP